MNKDELIKRVNTVNVDSLTNEEIIQLFNEIRNLGYNKFNSIDTHQYNKLWLAHAQIDPEGEWSEKDKVYFPSFGWIDGRFKGLEFLKEVSDALNKLVGVKSSIGTLYNSDRSKWKLHGRIVWWITFDNVNVFNHFLWASCFRYLPIEKNTKWELYADMGDPEYNEKKLKMLFCYMDEDAQREEWEEDVKYMAQCINSYAESEWNKNEDMIKYEG